MTLEPDRDRDREKRPRYRGKKRYEEAMKRVHLRELEAYEKKEAMGVGLTDYEQARHKALKDLYA